MSSFGPSASNERELGAVSNSVLLAKIPFNINERAHRLSPTMD